ncbi:hypothetical protein ACFQJC_14420 [Haloferax namakaokahaiae]|uniref:Uncharacterized protein n=1 Tax=Haloferax namakaokahaiae TaxID=1748331 RepID=A0ABD5ZHP0_9EURY
MNEDPGLPTTPTNVCEVPAVTDDSLTEKPTERFSALSSILNRADRHMHDVAQTHLTEFRGEVNLYPV